MNILKKSAQEYITTQWSGGSTTELSIFPNSGDFASRNFLYRLSIATIKISSSDFTPLQGISRTLLLLEGELKLIHEHHHEAFLMPFSQDQFDGGWKTHCIGIGTDFNLMTKDCEGTVNVYTDDILLYTEADHLIIYNYDGAIFCADRAISGKELLLLENPENTINLGISGIAIVVEIFLNK